MDLLIENMVAQNGPSHNLGPSSAKARRKQAASRKNPNRGNIFDSQFSRDTLYGSKVINPSKCLHTDSVTIPETGSESKKDTASARKASGKFKCLICGVVFDDFLDQRAHCKTDWHVFNVKRNILSKASVDEPTYLQKELLGDSSDSEIEETDEIDTTDQTENGNRKSLRDQESKIHFATLDNRLITVYRNILESSKEFCRNCMLFEHSLKKVSKDNCWIILMFSGGHFAAAVFHKREIIEHKAIHRYTVRAKSGTSQSVRDSKQPGKTPRSAGATIRRQNEATLVLEIQELLRNWEAHVGHADKIFIKWPQNVRSILFGGKAPIFDKSDVRFRKIPFMTGKPTFGELKRIHTELTTVRIKEMHCKSEEQHDECNSGSKQEELLQSIRTELSFNELNKS